MHERPELRKYSHPVCARHRSFDDNCVKELQRTVPLAKQPDATLPWHADWVRASIQRLTRRPGGARGA